MSSSFGLRTKGNTSSFTCFISAVENYRIMQNRYLNQLAILTDLLDANSVRLNAELQLTSARTQVIYTYYQLQHACGRL